MTADQIILALIGLLMFAVIDLMLSVITLRAAVAAMNFCWKLLAGGGGAAEEPRAERNQLGKRLKKRKSVPKQAVPTPTVGQAALSCLMGQLAVVVIAVIYVATVGMNARAGGALVGSAVVRLLVVPIALTHILPTTIGRALVVVVFDCLVRISLILIPVGLVMILWNATK